MDHHIIRLRGGWDCSATAGPDAGRIRLSLPARAEAFPAGRLRLLRRFHRPPRIATGSVRLRLSRCPGIRSVVFNGRPIGPTSPERSEFELDPGPLAPTNELLIETDPPRDEDEWGVIALVFAGSEEGSGD